MNDDLSWHWQLDLKLRTCQGNAFQTFIGDLLEACFGDDFVRVKPYGSLGDKGCDGYRQSDGAVFACYGAQNGAAGSVSKLLSKMDDDLSKAKEHLGAIMKSWHMTHNVVEGLPVEAVMKHKSISEANPELQVFLFGPPKIRELMGQLSEENRTKFTGPVARNSDYQHLQLGEVRDLVAALILAVESTDLPPGDLLPVSPQKLNVNNLSGSSQQLLRSGRINAPHIGTYFNAHPDPMRGETLAGMFRNRYAELKAQELAPDTILSELYRFVAGPGDVAIPRHVAATSLLSYLFESCDIFENAASPEVAQ